MGKILKFFGVLFVLLLVFTWAIQGCASNPERLGLTAAQVQQLNEEARAFNVELRFAEAQARVLVYVKQPTCTDTVVVGCAREDVKTALKAAEETAYVALKTYQAAPDATTRTLTLVALQQALVVLQSQLLTELLK